MNVNQVYEIVLYVAGKNLQQGYVSPDDFNNAINQAQNQYVDYILGEYQKYLPGRPIAAVEMSNKEKIRQSISPLIYEVMFPINPTTGIANFSGLGYPSDFSMVDAMWNVYKIDNIRFVQQPRLTSFVGSTIDLIDENPVYLLREEGLQFYPYNIGVAKMSYVRNPPSITWGYTLNSNGIPVWNPATSQDPVWGYFDMNNIISRALRIIGVNLSANEINQYAEEVKIGGQ